MTTSSLPHTAAAGLARPTHPMTSFPRNGSVQYQLRPNPSLAHGLTLEEISAFRRDGFVICRGRFTPAEVRAWQDEAVDLLERTSPQSPDNLRYEYSLRPDPIDGEKKVWKMDPFLDISPVFAGLSRDRRMLDPMASIYDGYEPRLFKDKLIFKPSGSHGAGLHQDYIWWQNFPKSLVSVSVAIDDSDRGNGCTVLYPGHTEGLMVEPGYMGFIPDERVRLDQPVQLELKAGDFAIFNAFVPHNAPANDSPRKRRVIFFSYNDARDGEHYLAHRDHFLWYRTKDMKPADLAQKYFI